MIHTSRPRHESEQAHGMKWRNHGEARNREAEERAKRLQRVEDDDGQIQRAVEETTVGILVVKRRTSEHPEMGIILEGQQVLGELDNVALAAAMLFGLMYALNLDYPTELKYTFEVLQKIIMKLEGTTMSKKKMPGPAKQTP